MDPDVTGGIGIEGAHLDRIIAMSEWGQCIVGERFGVSEQL